MTVKEAIKRIRNHMEVHRIGQYPHILIGEAFDMAIAALQEKEELEKRVWIPVTEKLPTTDGRFMVTIKGRSGKPHVEMRNFHAGSQKWENQYGWPQENVLAWQQRPKPYGYKQKEG